MSARKTLRAQTDGSSRQRVSEQRSVLSVREQRSKRFNKEISMSARATLRAPTDGSSRQRVSEQRSVLEQRSKRFNKEISMSARATLRAQTDGSSRQRVSEQCSVLSVREQRSKRFNKEISMSASQRGVTLVELILSIIIISIAATALLQALGTQTVRNAEPVLQAQSQALAQQYLQEVLSKAFFDPNADPRLNPALSKTDAIAGAVDQTASTSNATNRQLFDNVFEYHGYRQSAQSLTGSDVANLSGYQVAITVDASSGLALASLVNIATCPPQVMLITVSVTDPRNQTTALSGYRTSYFDNSLYSGC